MKDKVIKVLALINEIQIQDSCISDEKSDTVNSLHDKCMNLLYLREQ
jgi:hypothetical protein